MNGLKLPELPEPQIYDGYAWKAPFSKYDYFTAAQMLAIRDQGIKYGMELAAQIVENVTSEVWHDGNYAVADAIRSKAVQNTVQVSGKEGV
jgi:hypothetical protein